MAASMFKVASLLHGPLHRVSAKRLFSSCQVLLAEKWRVDHGLPLRPNSHGPLVDLPDYTYLDGRPTPLSRGQRMRREKQIAYSERIMQLLDEIDTTEKIYNEKVSEEEHKNKEIIRSKLKPKGGKKRS